MCTSENLFNTSLRILCNKVERYVFFLNITELTKMNPVYRLKSRILYSDYKILEELLGKSKNVFLLTCVRILRRFFNLLKHEEYSSTSKRFWMNYLEKKAIRMFREELFLSFYMGVKT